MAYGWLIAGILIIVALVAIFKSQDLMFIFMLLKKYFFVIIAFGLLLFLVFSIAHIQRTNDTDLRSFKGIVETTKVYVVWLKGVFGNVGKITGYAVNQDWFGNSTTVEKNRR